MSNAAQRFGSRATSWTGQTQVKLVSNDVKWCHFEGKIGELSEASSLVDVLWSDPFSGTYWWIVNSMELEWTCIQFNGSPR